MRVDDLGSITFQDLPSTLTPFNVSTPPSPDFPHILSIACIHVLCVWKGSYTVKCMYLRVKARWGRGHAEELIVCTLEIGNSNSEDRICISFCLLV